MVIRIDILIFRKFDKIIEKHFMNFKSVVSVDDSVRSYFTDPFEPKFANFYEFSWTKSVEFFTNQF